MLVNEDTRTEDLKNATMRLIEEDVIPVMHFIASNGNRNEKYNNIDSIKMFLNMSMKKNINSNDDALVCDNNQKVLKRKKF